MEYTAHLSYLFTELPLGERISQAKAAGFALVESVWPGDEQAALMAGLADAGLELYLVNTAGADVATGGAGCLNDPARQDEAFAAIRAAVDLGAPLVHALVGRGGGLDTVVAALREIAGELRATTLVVEHLNPHNSPGYLLPTPESAVELVELVASDRVRLLYDAFHAAMVGADPVRQIRDVAPYLGHVHYGEPPGRIAGKRFWEFSDAVESTGYRGRLGLEYFAHGAPVGYPVRGEE